jgi:hypothetical protein
MKNGNEKKDIAAPDSSFNSSENSRTSTFRF